MMSLHSMIAVFLMLQSIRTVIANPLSRPYIPFRTDPYDQPLVANHEHAAAHDDNYRSNVHSLDDSNQQCPLQFVLGVSKRLHGSSSDASGIRQAPVVYPVFAAQGPGRQVVYATDYEHLDLLTPAHIGESYSRHEPPHEPSKQTSSNNNIGSVKEILVQAADYPLLLEGSTFHSSPILHDVNGDGRMDVILADYDGGIFMMGLTLTNTNAGAAASGSATSDHRTRFFQSAQVPRLYVRRDWMNGRVNETLGIVPPTTLPPHPSAKNNTKPQEHIHDPYHSYFEMYSSNSIMNDKDVLRAISDNILTQHAGQYQAMQERRRKHRQRVMIVKENISVSNTGSGKVTNETSMFKQVDKADASLYDDDGGAKYHDDATDDLMIDHVKEKLKELYGGDEGGASQQAQQQSKHETSQHDTGDAVRAHRRLQEANERHAPELLNAGDNHVQPQQQHEANPRHEEHQLSNAELPEVALGANQHEQQAVQNQQHHNDNQHIPELSTEEVDGRMQQQQMVENEAGDAAREDVHRDSMEAGIKVDPPIREQGGLHDDFVNQPDQAKSVPDLPYDDYGIDDPNPRRGEHHRDPILDDVSPDYEGDDYGRYGRRYHDDDYYRIHNSAHQEYYDSKHYIRISPHVLATPTLAEMPKLYSNNDEKEEFLFVPVSYYLDEDEYEGYSSYQRFLDSDHGDETEVNRGRYVGSALLTYIMGDNPRWSSQQHLDLSTDYSAPENVTIVDGLPEREDGTRMGAFALASPTVADVDGDGKLEVVIGTGMGMVYCLDARTLSKKDNWPVQMRYPIESRIVMEDLVGDAHLELLVADVGGNIACFNYEGKRLWHRNLATSVGVTSHKVSRISPMVLGDVNGDGKLNIVVAIMVEAKAPYVFVLDAATGSDSINFPLQLDMLHKVESTIGLHDKLAQPLLVDLSTDHKFVEEYIRRRGASHDLSSSHSAGLHIVYPSGETLYIIDASSACTHPVPVGEVMTASVQVDDVHGTNKLDLVIATMDGNVITLESQTPYHPLNVWNNGETRSRFGGSVHGYSAPQGVYVHELSRQYTDVFGVYVHVTLEVFDNRRNVAPEHKKYKVEIRDGSSHKRVLLRAQYDEPGIYKERVFIRFGPGYYALHVLLTTSHGLVYEDVFHLGYNIHYMSGFGVLLWLPLISFGLIIVIFATGREDDETVRRNKNGDVTRTRLLPA
ncbi:hypothetical protein MPSEU_000264200 [Mayamaea pseudoterrestris]|nr:hypothetical protein MPSEU_000264200 [Mayamaea pseudoterrestris]